MTVFNVLSAAQGFKLYLWSHLFMTLNASVVLGIAFMFSCFNMKPAAATILALSLLFVNLVMEGIPFFERYHEYLLTYHFRSWLNVYIQPIPWAADRPIVVRPAGGQPHHLPHRGSRLPGPGHQVLVCVRASEIVTWSSQESPSRKPNILALEAGGSTTNGVFRGKRARNSSCVLEPFFLQFLHLK